MSSIKKVFFKVFFVFLFTSPIFGPILAWGGGIDLHKLTQGQAQFRDLSKELGMAISYVPSSPAEPLGITGFDVGIEITSVPIHEDKIFKDIVSTPPSTILLPKLHVQKGLPFGIDIGAVYTSVPGLDFAILGGEIKYALLSGNAAIPALAIRLAGTKLTGVNSLDLNTVSADLSLSKGVLFVTPFLGFGVVQTTATEKAGLNLKEEKQQSSKPFIGVKISLALINFVAEADFSETPLYTLRANVGW